MTHKHSLESSLDSEYKVLITTSGTGSRLKKLTKKTNKSLVKVKGKEVIRYIVDSYPEDVEIIVTLGYYGDKVRKFLKKEYLKRKFTFVTVDKYEGKGASLGYSMLQAKDYLQCPFIFHCNDTIILDKIPSPDKNWNGGSKGLDTEIFNSQFLSSFSVKGSKVTKLNPKGADDYDFFHIGLVGIKDYQDFWQALESTYKDNPSDSSLNDCSAIRVMLSKSREFSLQEFKRWYDTGNLKSLENAEKNI